VQLADSEIGWRFWVLWVVATNAGFWLGFGLEFHITGAITNVVAVPLSGVGQAIVLSRHKPIGWLWAVGSAVGWWLGMFISGGLLAEFLPDLPFWAYAVVFAGLAGIAVGATTLWVLRRAGLNADARWVAVTALAWAVQAPGMVTGIFLIQLLGRSEVPADELPD
jgi:hypothetical protein